MYEGVDTEAYKPDIRIQIKPYQDIKELGTPAHFVLPPGSVVRVRSCPGFQSIVQDAADVICTRPSQSSRIGGRLYTFSRSLLMK